MAPPPSNTVTGKASPPASATELPWLAVLRGAAVGIRVYRALLVASLIIFTGQFLRDAWVCDDAYITFRSVEQLFAGNGPVWNAGVRVQAFTHPLWFGVLSAGRLFTRDLFAVSIGAGLVFSVAAAGWLLVRFAGRSLPRLIFLTAAVISSVAFVDFATSGLENSLLNLLLVFFLATYLGPGEAHRRLVGMVFGASLMLLCRHDSVTLWLAPLVFAGVEYIRLPRSSRPRIAGPLLLAATPFLAWTVFSLVYYGVPFPNTAYAKLGAGVPAVDLAWQGLRYLENAFQWDPLTPLCILAGIVLPWFAPERRLRWLSVGLLLNCMYVVRIGGDFMAGRFWVSAFLVALVAIAASLRHVRFHWAAAAVVLVSVLLNPQAPPRFDPPHVTHNRYGGHGIADEKSFYPTNTFGMWLERDPWLLFPHHPWADEGAQFRAGDQQVAHIATIGMFGYFAGTQKTIVDGLALTDPFLARLPAVKAWRIGHFPRLVPDGYLDSIREGRNLVADPVLAAKYDQVALVTQGPLFTWSRWEAMLALNTGLSLGKARPQ